MAFRNWIKSKIKKFFLADTKEDGNTRILQQSSPLAPPRTEIRLEKESLKAGKDVLDNLPKLKQEYERLCLLLEKIKQSGEPNSSTVLQPLPELPKLSYVSTSVNIYTPPRFDVIPTMASMKEARIEEERYQHMMQEQKVTKLLGMASDYIGIGDYAKAHDALEAAGVLINTIENNEVGTRYSKLLRTLKTSEEEQKMLEREKRSEERKRKGKEKEEKQRFRISIQNKNSRRKVGDFIVLKDFSDNGIAYLYHFTSKANLKSIRANGGLYARAYHPKLNITAKDTLPPARLNKNNNVINFSEYVSLSVCKEHYMARELFDTGVDVCILKISTDVVGYYNTYFTDRDTSNERFRIGNKYQDTNNINFDAVKDDTLVSGDINYAQKFAEVLVDGFIPLSLIGNIDNPIKLK